MVWRRTNQYVWRNMSYKYMETPRTETVVEDKNECSGEIAWWFAVQKASQLARVLENVWLSKVQLFSPVWT